MEPRHTLRALFAHNDWARDKLMLLASSLSSEQLDRPFEMGPGSLRNTLRHLYGAERYWFEKWHGHELPQFPRSRDVAEPGALWDAFRRLAAARDTFLDGVTESDLATRVRYEGSDGAHATPLGDLLLHVTNHGIHHRAQALNMLRHVGFPKPPGLDYLFMTIEEPTVEFDIVTREKIIQMGFEPGAAPLPPVDCDVGTIREYFRYCDWARDRVHQLAAGLNDTQLEQPYEMGPGSIRKTLLHIRDAEQWWYENWTSGPERAFDELPETTSIADLNDASRRTAETRSAFLDGLVNEELKRVVSATVRPGTELIFRLGETMLQLCGHGVHHRAQVLNMLRHSGVEVPPLDYLDWCHATA